MESVNVAIKSPSLPVLGAVQRFVKPAGNAGTPLPLESGDNNVLESDSIIRSS
jgi:hypothetical protein